ncbi:hypothetical protein F2Q70_00016783 [Brassica cretica]|uniref:Uncharacterized protein n=1 Tax=Brassica cretica TaxID=69181 RepID=A0A8S9HUB4_BRACR|nr:hypothetical protein F2Q70_00016783 [Brassica cretica]
MTKRSPIRFAKAPDHCKGRGGTCDRLEKSWIKQKELYEQGRSSLDGAKVGESEGRALASHQLIGKGMDHEVFKRADLEAFFKALKESSNTLGNTLRYSYAAHTLPSTTDKGSESETEGLKDQGSEEAGGLEDQGLDSPVQSGDELVREVQNEGQEAGKGIQIQEEAVEEQVEVPLRRSTQNLALSGTDARSLRSDRAVCMCGSYVVTELGLSMFRQSHSNLSMAGSDTFPLPWDSLCLIQTGFEKGFISRTYATTFFRPSTICRGKTLILVFAVV